MLVNIIIGEGAHTWSALKLKIRMDDVYQILYKVAAAVILLSFTFLLKFLTDYIWSKLNGSNRDAGGDRAPLKTKEDSKASDSTSCDSGSIDYNSGGNISRNAIIRDDCRNKVVDGNEKIKEPEGTAPAQYIIEGGAKCVTKQATRYSVKYAAKHGAKCVTKQVAKGATKEGTKLIGKIISKGAMTPWSLGADLAQLGLEATGRKTEGQIVGAGGNIATAAIAGAMIGGPPGAIIGGGIGASIWIAGEGAGKVINWLWP